MTALLAAAALAKSPGWFRAGAGGVDLDDAVEVPLLRGPTTSYLPAVAVDVAVGGVDRPALAVLDVAGGWSRLSTETARALGVDPAYTTLDGRNVRYVVLDEVRAGDLSIRDLRVQIDDDAPGLVLGTGSVDALAVAILASRGTVRFAPAREGEALVASVGEPVEAARAPADGLTLRVPGALRWGEAVVDGSFHLRTDLATSRVAPSPRLPEPAVRSGGRFHDVGARLGEVWLPDTWIREDEALADPDPAFAGALGYDVLFAVDLAVARGRVAFREARPAKAHDATPASVAAAKARYAQEEEAARGTALATVAPAEAKVEIGFDGPTKTETPLGDPGNPVVRDRNLDLAETLWRAGLVEEALPYYLSASQVAGDHCGAHLQLGVRRLANAGPALLEREVVAKLVEDPIERASELWEAWDLLDAAAHRAIALGRDQPSGTVQVWQPPICGASFALRAAVARARGQPDRVAEIEARRLERDPGVAWARALFAIADGRWAAVEPLLLAVRGGPGIEAADVEVASALAEAATGDRDGLLQAVQQLPGLPTDHPLTAALELLSAARRVPEPDDVTRRLWRADERWVPGVLVHAMASRTLPPPWDPRTEERAPGSPQVACQKAVHLALTGDIAAARAVLRTPRWLVVPDWWAANAVVEHLAGDLDASAAARRELALRFPLIPVTDLGLPPAPASAPAPPPAPRLRPPG